MKTKAPGKVSDLVSHIRERNLVPAILDMEEGEDILAKIAERVIEDRKADKTSMEGWEKFLEAGRKLMRQDLEPLSDPWEGAANFKSPGMLEACLKFGDRAVATLLKGRDLVKYDVIGQDPEREKGRRGENITTHMNYQLNYEMKTWRDDHDRNLYILPSDGASFKYTYFDQGLGANVSELIRWPDFSVNQANTNMETCRSFTIDREYTQSLVLSRQREGIWHEYEDMEMIGTETQTEQREESESDEIFYIQQMFYDLDDDGYEEPYLVTVHSTSAKVMRITARYEEDNIVVKTPNGKVVTFDRVLDGEDDLGFEVTGDKETDMKNSKISQCDLVRIEPINYITDYSLIPGDLIPFEKEGSFLGIGYVHLLAGLTQAINSTSNVILNSGKLKSTPGGFLAKNFRKAKGTLQYVMGQFITTLMSPDELQNSVREFQWPDVGEGYFLFNDKMRAEIERLAASADLTDAIGANAPATTMLGMVQEQLMPLSAIMLRIYRSEKREFIKLADLNRKYTDPVVYKDLLGDEADYMDDYGMKGLDVMPASNPEMTSRIQNILQSNSVMAVSDRILQSGGDPIPVLKRHLEDLGVDYISEIFPEEKKENPQLDAMREATRIEGELAQGQLAVLQGELKNERMKTAISKAKSIAEIKEIESKMILNLEKAESEESKNMIDKYTKEVRNLVTSIQDSKDDNEAKHQELMKSMTGE